MARLLVANIERDTSEPFEVEFPDGEVFTFKDPKSIPAAEIINFDAKKPIVVLSAALGTDACTRFLAREDTDGYVLKATFEAYMEHYDLPLPGEASASPL